MIDKQLVDKFVEDFFDDYFEEEENEEIQNNFKKDFKDFVNRLRIKYNKNRSKLFMNIINEDKLTPQDQIRALGSYVLQLMIYGTDIEDDYYRREFYNDCELAKTFKALEQYAINQDYKTADEALKEIKKKVEYNVKLIEDK